MTAIDGAYRREDVLRMVAVTERQLRAWENLGLVQTRQNYGFSDLVAIKTLKRLRALRITPKQIQLAIRALKLKLKEIDEPLAQLRLTADGRRITVHVAGSKMEPISGQLLFDFDVNELEKLRAFPKPGGDPGNAGNEKVAEEWFQRGLALEETGAPIENAVAAYRKAIEADPKASGALVNLGTISFRMRRLKEAADFYARAMEADPEYPLAHFNIGNLNDEQGNFPVARKHYLEAIRLNPRYGDAYFNLALLCERNGELLQAIGYWHAYLKLDSSSSWARTARKQLERLKRMVRSK
jgi:tetratricopeptide (TPR) repeat protein